MISQLDRYKEDFQKLVNLGNKLALSIEFECDSEHWTGIINKQYKDKSKDFINTILDFRENYQKWYSESLILIKQLLPHRVDDFVRLYEKPKRKELTCENYRIEDYLQQIVVQKNNSIIVGLNSAIPIFNQQLAILKSVESRFESSLYDIRQLVQADLFDDELKSAVELQKHKFYRAAGAIAGVVLEKHLNEVCRKHEIKITKKNPSLSDYYNNLKDADIIDTPTWRHIQLLADLRNLCDHNKENEPKKENISDLIMGVQKIIKTLF